MEIELIELDKQIEDLEAKARDATGEAKRLLEEEVELLKDRRHQIRLKIETPAYREEEQELQADAQQAALDLRHDIP